MARQNGLHHCSVHILATRIQAGLELLSFILLPVAPWIQADLKRPWRGLARRVATTTPRGGRARVLTCFEAKVLVIEVLVFFAQEGQYALRWVNTFLAELVAAPAPRYTATQGWLCRPSRLQRSHRYLGPSPPPPCPIAWSTLPAGYSFTS